MKNWVINNKLLLAGIIVGALGGFLYWQQIGCTTGSCAITSKWHNSTAYGALMGGLLFSIFRKEKKERRRQIRRGTLRAISQRKLFKSWQRKKHIGVTWHLH